MEELEHLVLVREKVLLPVEQVPVLDIRLQAHTLEARRRQFPYLVLRDEEVMERV